MAGGAGRRARACGDRTARVGGIGDEAGGLRGIPDGLCRGAGRADEQQRALRGEADFRCAESFGRADEVDQGVGADMAEGQGDRHGEAGVGEGEDGERTIAALKVELDDTPLCPAGHLPLKGGDCACQRRFRQSQALKAGEGR